MLSMLISYILRLLPKMNLFENTDYWHGVCSLCLVILEAAVCWIHHALAQRSFVTETKQFQSPRVYGLLFSLPATLNLKRVPTR